MVVVGRDGRSGGDDAQELGRLLAACLEQPLLPVAVLVPGASPGARDALVEADGVRVVSAPSVARGLADVAAEVGASAIVIGSSRRSLIGRVLFGTDAGHLADLAPCPIAVAPRDYARRYAVRLNRVDARFDGSPESEQAVELAARIARSEGGSVRLLATSDRRDAAERFAVGLPGGVTYEVGPDDDGRERDDADLLILGRRSDARLHAARGCALLVL